MKKILFASTALVMTAGAAAADITLSGSANMGVFYDGSTTIVKNELDFGINASATSDAGIEFGASIDLDAAHNNSETTQGIANTAADTGVVGDDNISFDPEVYISSGGLTLTVGSVDPASDPMGIRDIGFDDIGADDAGEGAGSKGDADVIVSYTMGDYTFAASADTAGDDWAIAIQGTVSDLDFGLAYDEAAGVDSTWVDLSYSFGDITVGGFYVSSDEDGYGIEAAYVAGDLTVDFVYSKNDTTGVDAYGIGAAYNLGGGLGVAGGVGENSAGDTVADFGVTMSF